MSDTPRTDAVNASYGAGRFELRNLARELERELAAATATAAELRAENARIEDRLANITDRDLPPDRRSGANYWRAQYFESRREIANANRGIARLLRRLEGAKERIASLQSDAAMLRAENTRLHALLIKTDPRPTSD